VGLPVLGTAEPGLVAAGPGEQQLVGKCHAGRGERHHERRADLRRPRPHLRPLVHWQREVLGSQRYGELGTGSTTGSDTPVAVSGITNASQISAGIRETCAVLLTGSVKFWGNNAYGELGNGTRITSLTPTTVSGITNATAVSVGDPNSWARLSTGSVTCWGPNKALLQSPGGPPYAHSSNADRLAARQHTSSAAEDCPSLRDKRVTPHVLRHTNAMLLRARDIDILTIALWPGHESTKSTEINLHADNRLKQQAIERTTPTGTPPGRYKPPDPVLAFLDGL